jgi:catechol 2,3-dioxygenase-like lactoylglutathione lyase family enzyme
MSHARRFDHVGITVADLDTVTAFFVGLGLEVEGRTFVEGEFLDTVSGHPRLPHRDRHAATARRR